MPGLDSPALGPRNVEPYVTGLPGQLEYAFGRKMPFWSSPDLQRRGASSLELRSTVRSSDVALQTVRELFFLPTGFDFDDSRVHLEASSGNG